MSIQTIEDRLLEFIASGEPFTADDVTDLGNIHTGDVSPNHTQSGIGPLFNKYAARGMMVEIDYRRSASPRRKKGMVRVWRGVNQDEQP